MSPLLIVDILIHFIWLALLFMPGIADRDWMLKERERKELGRIKRDDVSEKYLKNTWPMVMS